MRQRYNSTPIKAAMLCLACSGLMAATATADPIPAGTATAAEAGTTRPAIDTRPVAALIQASTLPKGWHQGAFMEIFVRAYQDSDGDGIGDLRGLTRRLDYLKDLGITGIWLMPITASADHDHGYATTDFRALEPQYGTLADFDDLLAQAHRRGIGVITDYVVNHSAATHPLFLQSSQGTDNAYRDWFVWQDPAPTGWDIWGKNPWISTPTGSYFATFGAQMPDFNLKNQTVVDYHQSSLRFWLNRGLDGFRLDAVPHLIENDAVQWNDQPESRLLTRQLQALIKAYPQRHTVCEATAQPQAYADPNVCGSAFAFGLEQKILQAARGGADAAGAVAAVAAVANYFKTAPATMATMLSNHDIFAGERVWDQLAGNTAQYKLAAATYLLQPGTPFIYYGEEVGMAGVKGLAGDAPLRAPMSWDADGRAFSPDPNPSTGTQAAPFRPFSPNAARQNAQDQARDPASLLNFYKAMLKLRNSRPSISSGSYDAATAKGQVLTFQRRSGQEITLIAINYGLQPVSSSVGALPARAHLRALYPLSQAKTNSGRANQAGAVTLSLPAQSVRVYQVGR